MVHGSITFPPATLYLEDVEHIYHILAETEAPLVICCGKQSFDSVQAFFACNELRLDACKITDAGFEVQLLPSRFISWRDEERATLRSVSQLKKLFLQRRLRGRK